MNQESKSQFPLLGKVAFITGSSSGNGRAIALKLSEAGAKVLCADLRPNSRAMDFDGRTETHQRINDSGGQAKFVKCDVTDGESVKSAFEDLMKTFGRLDIVVANAGISPMPAAQLDEEDYELFREVTRINQEGAWWTAREGVKILRVQKLGGKVVFISSASGLVGSDAGAHYCMSKGAVNQLTRALASQVALESINVNAVCPGYIRTGMTMDYLSDPKNEAKIVSRIPMGRVGTVDAVASATAFALPQCNRHFELTELDLSPQFT
jgi:NAD(P)-dependent dehydrogenase (short-subunit alcohol dehydrogenase family)